MHSYLIVLGALGFLMCEPAHAQDRAMELASTLYGRHVVGYQGWFVCPSSPESGGKWAHWFRGEGKTADDLRVDMWPDTAELTAEERCSTGLKTGAGNEAVLFSSLNSKTVDRHFSWMKTYNIESVALQRFVSELTSSRKRAQRDIVLQNVVKSARTHKRAYFIYYDISGIEADKDLDILLADWERLWKENAIGQAGLYQMHRGKPVVGVWGLGFTSRAGSAKAAASLIARLKSGSGAAPPATIIGGVPTRWRGLSGDSKKEPEWADVYRSFDVISPWTVGRFKTPSTARTFWTDRIVPDMAETSRLGIDYLPVIFPGYSASNLKRKASEPNSIDRDCGRFYLEQVAAAEKFGARMLYTAMFDEFDEGTAIMKAAEPQNALPVDGGLITPDAESCDTANDWYLSLAGQATRMLQTNRRGGQ
ncbi:hypothetical protein FG93_05213 [Bosea sp. LC85]|nr:hypothetical protein FG93_05213 [Bosea sp. LC85]